LAGTNGAALSHSTGEIDAIRSGEDSEWDSVSFSFSLISKPTSGGEGLLVSSHPAHAFPAFQRCTSWSDVNCILLHHLNHRRYEGVEPWIDQDNPYDNE
jgi:hypothetical protein